MAKKSTVFTLTGATMLTTLLFAAVFAGSNSFRTFASNVEQHDHVAVLDSNDSPTASETYVDSVTSGDTFSEYTFTKVKAATGKLCTLDVGGTITKVERAAGLRHVVATFDGSLTLETSFDEDGDKTAYPLTSGLQTALCGNYISFVASSETTIESIVITYACTSSLVSAHELGQTSETVLNGTDLDRVWKCTNCDYKETRVDATGFNTYRTGSLVVGKHKDINETTLLTSTDDNIGEIVPEYKIDPNTDGNWDNKIHFDLLGHTNDNNGMTNVITRQNILTNYQISAVSFDLYMTSGSKLNIAAPDPTSCTGADKYHTYNAITAGKEITINNARIVFVDSNNEIVIAPAANTWYTVYVSLHDIANQPAAQYHCIELVTPSGVLYADDVRYWHSDPLNEILVEDLPEFDLIVNKANTGTATLADSSEVIDGVTTSFVSTGGAGSYKDQYDISYASNNSVADGGVGNYKKAWLLNRLLGVKSYSFDVYLTDGASVRLQSRISNTTNDHYTNFISAGGTYINFNNGTFNSNITITDGEGNTVAQNDAISANAWYTVTVDVSTWSWGYGTAGGYFNVSLVAPTGTIYIANLACHM